MTENTYCGYTYSEIIKMAESHKFVSEFKNTPTYKQIVKQMKKEKLLSDITKLQTSLAELEIEL